MKVQLIDYGDPRLPPRFWTKVYPEPNTGCWLWGGAVSRKYGRYNHQRQGRWAYAVAFSELVGPVPAGLELDHTCRQHCCVNPAHLEPVTHVENVLRYAAVRYRELSTHCKWEHEFTPENTRWRKDGGRECKKCELRRGAAYSRTEKGRVVARRASARYAERMKSAS